ncbi:MAG: hypothetical protein M3P91_05275 [Actinomycetota bacterium]|nr:hypothetical protein [Actinomycetota bacterium]
MSGQQPVFVPLLVPGSAEHATAASATVLDRYIDRLNAADLAGMDACLHFPHHVRSGGVVETWPAPGRLTPSFFDELRDRNWSYCSYLHREVVAAAAEKVTWYVRYGWHRADGSLIAEEDSTWVLTLSDGRWGIRMRSV